VRNRNYVKGHRNPMAPVHVWEEGSQGVHRNKNLPQRKKKKKSCYAQIFEMRFQVPLFSNGPYGWVPQNGVGRPNPSVTVRGCADSGVNPIRGTEAEGGGGGGVARGGGGPERGGGGGERGGGGVSWVERGGGENQYLPNMGAESCLCIFGNRILHRSGSKTLVKRSSMGGAQTGWHLYGGALWGKGKAQISEKERGGKRSPRGIPNGKRGESRPNQRERGTKNRRMIAATIQRSRSGKDAGGKERGSSSLAPEGGGPWKGGGGGSWTPFRRGGVGIFQHSGQGGFPCLLLKDIPPGKVPFREGGGGEGRFLKKSLSSSLGLGEGPSKGGRGGGRDHRRG